MPELTWDGVDEGNQAEAESHTEVDKASGIAPVRKNARVAATGAAAELDRLRRNWLDPEGADAATLKARTLTNPYNARLTWLAGQRSRRPRPRRLGRLWLGRAGPDDHSRGHGPGPAASAEPGAGGHLQRLMLMRPAPLDECHATRLVTGERVNGGGRP